MEWKAYPVPRKIKLNQMYTIFTRNRESGYSFPGETHNFWECLYVYEGSLSVSADERVYLMSGGDIIFHKPMELHKYDVLSKCGAKIMVFSFSLEGSGGDFFAGKAFSLDNLTLNLMQTLFEDLTRLKNEDRATAHTVELLEKKPLCFGEAVAKIELLMYMLCNISTSLESWQIGDARLFGKVVLFLKENLEKNLTVQEIADRFFVGTSTLKRVFKQNSGLGIHSYFLKLKLAAACEMLGKGLSISEASDRLGFSDPSYFATAFKREIGQTPQSFQKANFISQQ